MVTSSPTGIEGVTGAPRLVVGLNRCQSYGQCVFAAPTVFRFHGVESLEYDYAPDPASWVEVRRAAAACPVQAISLGVVPGSDTESSEAAGA
jgi:ferredoxin